MLNRHPKLLRYYPLHGDGQDYSGNGYHLTISGATFIQERGRLVASLDGVDDYLSAAATGLPGSTNPSNATFLARVNCTNFSSGRRTILNYGTGGNFAFCLDVYNPNGELAMSTDANGYTCAGTPFVSGTPQHISWQGYMSLGNNINNSPEAFTTFDGRYSDDPVPSFESAPSDLGTLYIGRRVAGGQQFAGTLSDISIWSERLSLAQIRAIFAGGNPVI